MPDGDFKWRWAHVDESGRAGEYVGVLDAARADDDPAHFPNTLTWIDARPGERILEVGCGNGAVARAVARGAPAVREVVAVDASAAMIAAARRRLAGRDLPVAFAVADAGDLPFPDGLFDRCYAVDTFVILPDPRRALRELARVTRPGGRVLLWESDPDAHTMLGSDLDLTRRLMRWVGDHAYNGAVGRQLVGWLKEMGWPVEVAPAVGVGDELSSRLAALLREWLADAQAAGVVTPREADAFLADLERRQRAGTFFSYTVNFRITAVKPSGC